MCMHTRARVCTYIDIYIHIRVRTYMQTYVNTHTRIHSYVCIYLYTQRYPTNNSTVILEQPIDQTAQRHGQRTEQELKPQKISPPSLTPITQKPFHTISTPNKNTNNNNNNKNSCLAHRDETHESSEVSLRFSQRNQTPHPNKQYTWQSRTRTLH